MHVVGCVAGKLTGSKIKSTRSTVVVAVPYQVPAVPGIIFFKIFTLLQPRQKKVEAFQSQTRSCLARTKN